jgi:hypothetical protein
MPFSEGLSGEDSETATVGSANVHILRLYQLSIDLLNVEGSYTLMQS